MSQNREVCLSDLKACGGWLDWEEFREIRRQNLIDGLREVFDPESASNLANAERREAQTKRRDK